MSWGRVLTIDAEAEIEALRGEDGLHVLQMGIDPDLVLLDVSRPGLVGWAVLERIRSASEVPVIMLTARASELEKLRTYVSYLRKKLRESGVEKDCIETVRGFGCRYRPPAG